MAKIISGVIVLLVVVWLYVAISYMYKKKNEGGCCGDCSRCSGNSNCSSDKKNGSNKEK